MLNLIHSTDSLFDFGQVTQTLWALACPICEMKTLDQMISKILTTLGSAYHNTYCGGFLWNNKNGPVLLFHCGVEYLYWHS